MDINRPDFEKNLLKNFFSSISYCHLRYGTSARLYRFYPCMSISDFMSTIVNSIYQIVQLDSVFIANKDAARLEAREGLRK